MDSVVLKLLRLLSRCTQSKDVVLLCYILAPHFTFFHLVSACLCYVYHEYEIKEMMMLLWESGGIQFVLGGGGGIRPRSQDL